MTTNHLDWQEVEQRLDSVAAGDSEGLVAAFLEFEGRALDQRDGRGARQTVCISTFCQHFGLGRQSFARRVRAQQKEAV